jgi:hypothetical protein
MVNCTQICTDKRVQLKPRLHILEPDGPRRDSPPICVTVWLYPSAATASFNPRKGKFGTLHNTGKYVCTRTAQKERIETNQMDGLLALDVCLTFRNHASYIYDGQTTTLQTPNYIYIFFSRNIRTEFFKHAAHSAFFPLQNAIYFIMLPFFGSCIIHILHKECAKI